MDFLITPEARSLLTKGFEGLALVAITAVSKYPNILRRPNIFETRLSLLYSTESTSIPMQNIQDRGGQRQPVSMHFITHTRAICISHNGQRMRHMVIYPRLKTIVTRTKTQL
jgi:hypothetical protein